jgi:hypothetical protein
MTFYLDNSRQFFVFGFSVNLVADGNDEGSVRQHRGGDLNIKEEEESHWGKPDAIASQQGAGDPVQNSGRSYNESTEVV